MKPDIAKNKILSSPLKKTTIFSTDVTQEGASMAVPLLLTPLVDAFAILVIYLLVNTSASQSQVLIDGTIDLPMALKSQTIETGIKVVIKEGAYQIEGRTVSSSSLVSTLRAIMAQQNKDNIPFLLVQADKESDYQLLSPVMLAGSAAGFAKIKFAVIQGGSQ